MHFKEKYSNYAHWTMDSNFPSSSFSTVLESLSFDKFLFFMLLFMFLVFILKQNMHKKSLAPTNQEVHTFIMQLSLTHM